MTGAEARRRLLAGLPVRQRRVDAGGVSTALLEGGAGSPLLLLHGGIECGGAYWAPVIPRLVENHRVVVPDAPGLGESEPLARLDDETFAHWLRDLIRLTCDARPTLVAHSLFGTGAAVTVRTQAFQLWLNQTAQQLGWAHRNESVAGAYVEPLDTYCEMSHLLPVEHYEGTRAIAYFCGVQKEDRGGDQAAATEFAKQDALEFLRRDVGPLWPRAVDEDGALRPDLLVGGVEQQYWRANIAGSERYVLSPAGTITQRVSPAGFGVENLLPVGDWTRTGVDGGCVEAAAISGVRAAHTLIGDDHEIPGEDPRWLRKR
jgi:hypothetical protein